MSSNTVKEALKNFATRSENTSIVFKAPWGTGKTHLWKSTVSESKKDFSLKKYSYISLFGINSLGELKRQLFESSVDKNHADVPVSVDELINNLDSATSKVVGIGALKKLTSHTANLASTFVRGLGPTIDSVQFAMVSDTLICIDDFERKGLALSDRDVLGLISQLIETKNCRVILILNENTLKPDAEFFSFNEKVFNYEISYSPNTKECTDLVFDSASKHEAALASNCNLLKINNIRILKRIHLFYSDTKHLVDRWHAEIVNQYLHTLPLAILAIYGVEHKFSDIKVIESIDEIDMDFFDTNTIKNDEEKAADLHRGEVISFLNEYGFTSYDEFDKSIVDLVRKGYADHQSMAEVIDALDKKILRSHKISQFKLAWDLYKESLTVSDNEVFNSFEAALSTSLSELTIKQLDSLSFIYDGLDQTNRFNEHVDLFFSIVNIETIDLHEELNYGNIKNTYIYRILENLLSKKLEQKDFISVMDSWPDFNSIENNDILILSNSSTLEYCEYFKSLRGREISACIISCLKLGRSGNGTSSLSYETKFILVRVYEAILKISGESKLNTIRTGRFLSDHKSNYDDVIKYLESLGS